jgi:hypothetical protein
LLVIAALDPAIQRFIEDPTKRWMRGSSPRLSG